MLDQKKRDRLGTRYQLQIRTLSPIHVGSGGEELQRRTPDYIPVNGKLIVIDSDRLSLLLEPKQIEGLTPDWALSELIDSLSDDQKLSLAAYAIPDPGGAVSTIRPHVKLPGAAPYLPGSSLKGALRTAIACAILEDGSVEIQPRELGYKLDKADDRLDRTLFGNNPNQDLLRAFHVGDSNGAAGQNGLHLEQVSIYSIDAQKKLAPKGEGYRFHLETIPAGTELTAAARRDNFILEPSRAHRLRLEKRSEYLLRLPYHVNRMAERIIEQEGLFYQRYGPQRIADFYDHLEGDLARMDRERSCLVHTAWGAGWTGKTVGSTLDEALLKEIKARFRLGRPNTVFPKTRRLVERSSEAVMPLGWLQVTFKTLGEEIIPSKPVKTAPVPRPGRPQKAEDLEAGKLIEGTVTGIAHFGAFVNIGLPFNGLVHISELSRERVERVEDVVRIGQVVQVRVIQIDIERRRVSLSLKQV